VAHDVAIGIHATGRGAEVDRGHKLVEIHHTLRRPVPHDGMVDSEGVRPDTHLAEISHSALAEAAGQPSTG
jgi:hypothetical protein